MKKVLVILALCVLLALCWLALPRRSKEIPFLDPVTVRRGQVVHLLRETGRLWSEEPVLVACKFEGTVEWIIEDGVWVEKGEKVCVTGSQVVFKRVGELRAKLSDARQELRLAMLRKEHTRDAETAKLDIAIRRHELEKIRYRILTEKPVGGKELVRLHEQLLPMEEDSRELQSAFEQAQDKYLAARDFLLEAQDEYQAMKDKLLNARSRIEELRVETDKDTGAMQPLEREKHEESLKQLSAAQEQVDECERQRPALLKRIELAQGAAAPLKASLEDLRSGLETMKDQTRELYVRLEIEKRGAPLAQLKLEEGAALLKLDAARKRHEDGKAAFESGAMSQGALDALSEELAARESELKIVQQKVKIASRPPPREKLEEAKVKLEKAAAEAEAAREVYEQAMAIEAAAIAQIEARIAKLEFEFRRDSDNYADVIEAGIRSAERELKTTDLDDHEQRSALTNELSELRARLAEVKKDPPSIYRTPVSGIVNLAKHEGEPARVGERRWPGDPLARIFDMENMAVNARMNEVNVRHVRHGMPATVIIPALQGRRFAAKVREISAVAGDKFSRLDFRWKSRFAFAGVTQFGLTFDVVESDPGFRPGMAVIVELEVDRREDAIWIPLGAVCRDGERRFVYAGEKESPSVRYVEGEVFGDDCFVVTKGLEEGETVWIKRRRGA